MSTKLNKREIEKFSRQIILKNIGALGQRKIQDAKVLIIGMGGLGCPAAEFLTRSGIGTLGIVDHDKVSLSNIHRQTLYTEKDVNKSKVKIAKKKLNKKEIEKFSRQIILRNIGALGQKKIQEAKVLIIGMGGLGCPAAEFLTRSGIGTLGLSLIHI